MLQINERQAQVEKALLGITLPEGIGIRAWTESDFPAIQQLSTAEGWSTPQNRPVDSFASWQNAWPTLVMTDHDEVIGFIRALTDGSVTMYIAEVVISSGYRGRQFGKILLEVCHRLYPSTRLDLLSTEPSVGFYDKLGFQRFQGFRKR